MCNTVAGFAIIHSTQLIVNIIYVVYMCIRHPNMWKHYLFCPHDGHGHIIPFIQNTGDIIEINEKSNQCYPHNVETLSTLSKHYPN